MEVQTQAIPYLDLHAQDAVCERDVRAAIDRVLASKHFIQGPEGAALEQEVASICGTSHAVGLNSGTDALKLALRALGIGPGDRVMTTPFTFIATAEMIAEVGALPVFVDVEDATLNIDPEAVREKSHRIKPTPKAIIAVDLFGLPADYNALNDVAKSHGIPVIEDMAQAIGATYHDRPAGSLAFIGCISFFPAKNLGAYGDAGMVVTNNGGIATWIRQCRNHGSTEKYHHAFLGCSSRLDELQAAILRAKLPHLSQWNHERGAIAAFYNRYLQGVDGVRLATPVYPTRTCVYQQYTIRVERRDDLAAFLKERGIPTAVHYPMPLHLQDAFLDLKYAPGDFPVAERASKEVLSLPCYPGMPLAHQERVVEGVRTFFGST